MAVTARRATISDVASLIDMMREFYAEANYSLDQDWADTSFRTLLSNDAYGAVWIVSEDGKHLAGYIVLTVRFSMEFGGLDGVIDDLFVRPFYRRRGMAHAALQALLAECKQRGVLALHVEVAPDNAAAQALYERYGLREGADERQMLVARLRETGESFQ